ncbi:hypothetical protein SAMN06295926_101449 [Lysinibacillus sp. AC-3]|nr:hypothetical protein SAMN06295926_101449 [Lysinibacillus sp. AC-3]
MNLMNNITENWYKTKFSITNYYCIITKINQPHSIITGRAIENTTFH